MFDETSYPLANAAQVTEFLDSLRKAMDDADAGKGKPAHEVFNELNEKYGF